jgi:hypothetical protein
MILMNSFYSSEDVKRDAQPERYFKSFRPHYKHEKVQSNSGYIS